MQKAILVERDYKGIFERFALTPDEFRKEFELFIDKGMPLPTTEGDTYTLKPLVHVWYCATEVDSELWTKFFTNIEWGMAEGDIKSGNLAYIRHDFMQSLNDFIPRVNANNDHQKPSLNNMISSAEAKSEVNSIKNHAPER